MTLERQLFERMLMLRLVEERIAAIYHEADEIRTPTHLYTGQEAVAVGVCSCLEPDDVVHASHRSHGLYLAKGGNLRRMMAELFGKKTGCSGGWGGSMHLVDPEVGVMGSSSILGGTISHAVGSAFAFKMQSRRNVAVAGFGDAGVEEGSFHEALNIAALKKLPVIFCCENNLYSTQSALDVRQPPVEIYRRAESCGLPGVRVDGNDVLKVREAALPAVARARAGDGPTLLECMTYRWREHVGPNYDYDVGYRSKAELDAWMARDPIKPLALRLPADQVAAITSRIEADIDDAIAFARRSEFPSMKEIRA